MKIIKPFHCLYFYNNELYTKDFIDLFLSSLEKIMNEIIDADLDKTNISDTLPLCVKMKTLLLVKLKCH